MRAVPLLAPYAGEGALDQALMALFVVRLLLTTWLTLAFRMTLGPKLAIADVQPDLVAALVFYLTLRRGGRFGILAGFVLGLLVDVDHPEGIPNRPPRRSVR